IVAAAARIAGGIARAGEANGGVRAGVEADRTLRRADAEQTAVENLDAGRVHLQRPRRPRVAVAEEGKHQLAARVDGDPTEAAGAGEIAVDHHVRPAAPRPTDLDRAAGAARAARQRDRLRRHDS